DFSPSLQMAPKISLLHVTADSSLLERECAAQEFITAANAVFFKAQGLATLAPLHEMWTRKSEVHQACVNLWSLNKQVPWATEFGKMVVLWEHAISTIEQIKLMHFEKMAIELESTVPTVAPKPVVNLAPTPVSATLSIQRAPSVPYIANPSSPPMRLLSELSLQEQEEFWRLVVDTRTFFPMATEDDNNDEEATQKLRKELEDFVVPTTLLPPPSEYFEGDIGLPWGAKILGGRKGDITLVSPATRALVLSKNGTCDCCIADNMADHCWYPTGKHPCWHCYCKSKGCLWNGVSVRTQKKRPPLAALVMAKHIKLVQVAKAFLEWQGKPSQFFVLEEYKGKGKAKALLEDSEQTSAKQSFKSRELVDSDSDKEDEEDRVHVIKKIKREHVEELTSAKRRKEIIELDEEVEIVAPKTPVAGPLCPTSKPIVLVPSAPKFVPKPVIALASPVAGPSTAPIVSSSADKPQKVLFVK
ncbi:hypothetical protein C0995_009650, partial [Termitomyces sp. Mi166